MCTIPGSTVKSAQLASSSGSSFGSIKCQSVYGHATGTSIPPQRVHDPAEAVELNHGRVIDSYAKIVRDRVAQKRLPRHLGTPRVRRFHRRC